MSKDIYWSYLGVHRIASLKVPEGRWGLNARTAVAEPRSSFKGGEEKSPYWVYFSTPRPTLLDGERTIALLLFDKLGTRQGPFC